ncbi:MAG: hypothetical protein N2376_09700 [Clostridia bacterium]|nr:hypothetical protein [Clostridia bacterium]
MGDFIRYHEAEKLFELLPTLQIVLKNLHTDLSSLKGNIHDAIYSQVVGNHQGGSMPPTGSISDKTGNVAIRYRREAYLERTQIIADINELSTVIDKINFALSGMRSVQRLVLETYYWSENNTWKQVLEVLRQNSYFMSKSKATSIRNSAIEYIVSVARITYGQYTHVLDLIKA